MALTQRCRDTPDVFASHLAPPSHTRPHETWRLAPRTLLPGPAPNPTPVSPIGHHERSRPPH
eukprot:scaffold447955_cov15-Prasinocladus_malaysianus.AAC.1